MLDSPEAIASWQLLVDMQRTDKSTPPDLSAWDYPEILVAFQEGVIPMASFLTPECRFFPTANNRLNSRGIRARATTGGSKKILYPRQCYFIMNAASDQKDETWDFMSWVTGPEGGLQHTDLWGKPAYFGR